VGAVTGRVGEVGLEVDEGRARDVTGEELLAPVGPTQLPPDVEQDHLSEQVGELLGCDQRFGHAADHRIAPSGERQRFADHRHRVGPLCGQSATVVLAAEHLVADLGVGYGRTRGRLGQPCRRPRPR